MGLVQNINYIASLDGRYGRKLTLEKANLALGTVSYTITTKLNIYDANQMIDVEALEHVGMAVNIDGLDSYVQDLVDKIQLLGYTATGTVTTNGVLRSVKVDVVSATDLLVGMQMVIVSGVFTKYTIDSVIDTPLKVLPYLADKGPEFADAVQKVGAAIDSVNVVNTNIADINKVATAIDADELNVVASNITDIQKAALTTELEVTVNTLESGAQATSNYDSNSNTLELGLPKGAVGTKGASPQYEMQYDETTGMLNFVLVGYIEAEDIV
jgi:uncharacterized membrane protein